MTALTTEERLVMGELDDVWRMVNELHVPYNGYRTGRILRGLRDRGLVVYRPPGWPIWRGQWASTEAGDAAYRAAPDDREGSGGT